MRNRNKNTRKKEAIYKVSSNTIFRMCRDTGVIEEDMYRGKMTRRQDV
jgi:hypothetical protein